MKVAAVVVTFNRKEDLLKNVRGILAQKLPVDKFYIVDNHSTDGTELLLKEENIIDNPIIKYIYLNENIGGAGGFYTGLKAAYDDGAQYICLMDDDGRPADDNMMKELITKADKIHSMHKLFMLNSLVLGFDGVNLAFGLSKKIQTKQEAFDAMDDNHLIVGKINSFNGTLVSRELIDKIGFVNKDFFIKGDEIDYCSRARAVGAYMATVCDSLYMHPTPAKCYARILWKEYIAITDAPWKEYYLSRNYTYMYKKAGKIRTSVIVMIQNIIWAIKLNPQKLSTIKMIIKGWYDGMKGNLGISVKPGQK